MKRADMVRHGAQQLIDAENAVETALGKVAGLISSLTEMRVNSDMSMVIGQEAMDALVASTSKLSEVRSSMITAHEHLDSVKTQMGCRTVAAGTLDKPEKEDKPPQGLLVVPNQRDAA